MPDAILDPMLQDRGYVLTNSGISPAGNTLRRDLRAATEVDHRRLEAALDLESPCLSRDRYLRVLAAFCGCYAPLEARLRSVEPVAPALGFPLPARARLLELDLAALGGAHAVPRCTTLPKIETTAELAGCLYVLEGSALGGQVLARALARRWQLTPRTGTAFFFGSGPVATKRRWALVLDWLQRAAEAGVDSASAASTASATFVALERWACLQGATG